MVVRSLGIVTLVTLGACTLVSDGQYDDRAGELEEAREEFLPGTADVQFYSAIDDTFYYVDITKPLDEPLLHAYRPATDQTVALEITRDQNNIGQNFHTSGELVVRCGFTVATAYDAHTGAEIAMTSTNDDICAVAGDAVYFVGARAVQRWVPGQDSAPVALIDLDASGVGTDTVVGLAVVGNLGVLAEGGRLWRLDFTTGRATWMENPDIINGNVVFDGRIVLYPASGAVLYQSIDATTGSDLRAAIADGGYRLNAAHDDIHELASGASSGYTLYKNHVVYRANRGIFALDLDSGKVRDLLLDRGEGFEARPRYGDPVVTSDGTLFVQDNTNATSGLIHPIYRVPLSDRL